MNPTGTTTFRARYVVPVSQPPIEDGAVVVQENQIVGVGTFAKMCRQLPTTTTHDLGDCALLPKWVNTHTHLEFSDLDAPIGYAGIPFTDWIRLVVQHRHANHSLESLTNQAAVEAGIIESSEHGVGLIGEIATQNFPANEHENSRLAASKHCNDTLGLPEEFQELEKTDPHVLSFFELIGSGVDRIASAKSKALEHGHQISKVANWDAALSPHAPYSCQMELVRWACEQSRKNRFPVAMHIAETKEELELLAEHNGPFREMLEEFGVWNPAVFEGVSGPIDFLKSLATASRSLVIHGNYLVDEELEFVAQHDRMSVVYCPRTHAYFDHDSYPLQKMLSSGVRVAIGTDSRASNPDLSIRGETKLIAQNFPNIDPIQILEMATISGAEALGMQREFGTLEVGKRASLNMITCSDKNKNDLIEHLVHGD